VSIVFVVSIGFLESKIGDREKPNKLYKPYKLYKLDERSERS